MVMMVWPLQFATKRIMGMIFIVIHMITFLNMTLIRMRHCGDRENK